jgi:3-hydroxy-9,10-secoandrosta-1,3,5(10)-triene-9,17-dione monooxygenase
MNDAAAAASAHVMTRERLLERARTMGPGLKARAEECERIRQLPAATHRDFVAAGFYRIHQPKRFGGYELDWALLLDLGAEIGRACASSAWVFAQLAGHVYIQGMRDIKAQEELWGGNQDATVSSAFPIAGKTTPVAGGYVLDGEWNFASG